MAVKSSGLQQRIKDMYSDNKMSTSEFTALRDEADVVFASLVEKYPGNSELERFRKGADDVVQAMQLSILAIRKTKPSVDDKTLVKESFGFQVAYIKACLDRFTQDL